MSLLRVWVPVAAATALLAAVLTPTAAGAVECWRGWGYWVDGQTRAYKSGELLLVTKGPAAWAPGRPVALYLLDRESGRIAPDAAPITVKPINPRAYYRGRLNYVDGIADVDGSRDRLVFGLSHIAPPSAPIEKLEDYNAWACGLGGARR
ncbi:MAG: hypothetical protein ACE5GS_03655 [Kiloniellaceae bacterium]